MTAGIIIKYLAYCSMCTIGIMVLHFILEKYGEMDVE